jgi:Type II secretion system protein B
MFLAVGISTPLEAEILAAGNGKFADPTRPLDFVSSPESKGEISITRSGLVVESVLISPSRRIVVINGRSLRRGDFLNGMEITQIDEDSVGIRKDGQTHFLKPEEGTVVKTQS